MPVSSYSPKLLISRRELLRLGGIAGLGLMMPGVMTGCGSSDSPVSYEASRQDARKIAQGLISTTGVTSLGIALTTADRLIWADTYGFADLQPQQKATAATMFGIASVTKVVTAVAVMQLVEQKLVKLEDKICDYLPEFIMADPTYRYIKVYMLLDHSAGFPGTNYINYIMARYNPDYLDQLLEALKYERLKPYPGYACIYSNDGYSLAALLIQKLTGRSYAQYVASAILEPLGMTRSYFPSAPFGKGDYAVFYSSGAPQPQEFSNSHAAGGLYTTPTDLAAFARMLLNQGSAGTGRILSADSVERMAKDQTIGTFNPARSASQAFGFGWDSVTEPGLEAVGVRGWTKNGGTAQYGAQLTVAPDAGLAVVVMGTNGAGYSPLTISQQVLLRALQETGRTAFYPSPIAPVSHQVVAPPDGLISSITGFYANFEAIYQLRETNGSLSLLQLQSGTQGFNEILSGFKYRSDGWFTADDPRYSFRLIKDGSWYLVYRLPDGNGHYLTQLMNSQKIQTKVNNLTAAWGRRIGKNWLIVNEDPDSLFLTPEQDHRFKINSCNGLDGLIVAWQPIGGFPAILDPSSSDSVAQMMLVIPGINGRDLNDLMIVMNGDEEWLRWGGWMHRPMDTVRELADNSSTVTIGSEGYAEWRTVSASPQQRTITVTGASAWRLYEFTDSSFTMLGNSKASATGTLPANIKGYLIVYGSPDGDIGITIA